MKRRRGTLENRGESYYSEVPPVLLGIPWPALRGHLRNHFWKKRRPQPYWGGENSGNALEASNALNCRVWGIPAVLSRGIPGNALRAFPGSFQIFSGNSSGKSQPYWGYGPITPITIRDETLPNQFANNLGKVIMFGYSIWVPPELVLCTQETHGIT